MKGNHYEKAEQNEPVEGNAEKKECKKLPEKVQRRKKVPDLMP
jgi:hypothetical protein